MSADRPLRVLWVADKLGYGDRLHDVGLCYVSVLPSMQWLFGSFDEQLGHFRRYARHEVMQKFAAAGFEVERLSYFNLFGMLGWYLNGRVFRRTSLSMWQLRLYGMLIPFLKAIEDRLDVPVGLSMVVVGKKRPEQGGERLSRWGVLAQCASRLT